MVLSEIEDENLFYFFVAILETKFDAAFSSKAEIIDSKYFDFSLNGFHLTLHYQLYVGIELSPLSFFSVQKSSVIELNFIEELGLRLLEEKNAIETELKGVLNEVLENTKSIEEIKTDALNEIVDVNKKTFNKKTVEFYFIGKSYEELVAIIGSPKQFGHMDRGRDIIRWKVRNTLIEVWFCNGFWAEVILIEMYHGKASKHFRNRILYFLTLFLIFFMAIKFIPLDNYGGVAYLILLVTGIPFVLGIAFLVFETIYLIFKGNNQLFRKNFELLLILILVFLLMYLFR